MPLIIPSMPVVGALIGLVWYAGSVVLGRTSASLLIQSAVILLIPFVLSGFLHIDGYMDTADAVFSRRNIEEKRRILKDSHVGAFAVIALGCLFLLQFSAVYTIAADAKELWSLIFIPVLSRGTAGTALLNGKAISENGFAATFKANTRPRHTAILLMIMAIALAAAYWTGGFQILLPLSVTILSAVLVTIYVCRQLQGISGDLCGCIITVSEMAGLLCLALI